MGLLKERTGVINRKPRTTHFMLDNKNFKNNTQEVLLKLSGKLHIDSVVKFSDEIIHALENDNINKVTIDLSGVQFMDCSSLGVLVTARKKAINKGKKLILQGLKGEVKELFHLTRILYLFETH